MFLQMILAIVVWQKILGTKKLKIKFDFLSDF